MNDWIVIEVIDSGDQPILQFSSMHTAGWAGRRNSALPALTTSTTGRRRMAEPKQAPAPSEQQQQLIQLKEFLARGAEFSGAEEFLDALLKEYGEDREGMEHLQDYPEVLSNIATAWKRRIKVELAKRFRKGGGTEPVSRRLRPECPSCRQRPVAIDLAVEVLDQKVQYQDRPAPDRVDPTIGGVSRLWGDDRAPDGELRSDRFYKTKEARSYDITTLDIHCLI
jgi:hypothetical protein